VKLVDAIDVEYAFAALLRLGDGRRGHLSDADVLGGGSEAVAEVLHAAAEAIEQRARALPAAAAARLCAGLAVLRDAAKRLDAPSAEAEPALQVIGALAGMLDAVLEVHESASLF
jgi:hypothetical protein